MVQFKRNAAHP